MAAGQVADDAVGRPLVSHFALQATTGEAAYVDDMPTFSSKVPGQSTYFNKPLLIISCLYLLTLTFMICY